MFNQYLLYIYSYLNDVPVSTWPSAIFFLMVVELPSLSKNSSAFITLEFFGHMNFHVPSLVACSTKKRDILYILWVYTIYIINFIRSPRSGDLYNSSYFCLSIRLSVRPSQFHYQSLWAHLLLNRWMD